MSVQLSTVAAVVSVDGDEFGAHVVLRRHDSTGSTAPQRIPLPRNQLDRTNLEVLLNAGRTDGADQAARRYARHLRGLLSWVWPKADGPVLVVVSGPAVAHRPQWEALHLTENCLVVHVTEPVERVPDPSAAVTPAELVWLGSRPRERDLPRYLVLGAVLDELLRSGAAVVPWALRTDTRRADLDPRRWPAPATARIVHLDAHGRSGVEVAGDGLDAVFSFQVRDEEGPVSVPDTELLELLRALGGSVFLTNSCSAAQQRGINETPFPAQAVSAGTRVALGVREPLQAGVAVALFRPFYARLVAGAPVDEAMRAGLDGIRAYRGSADERAYRLLQPTMWLGHIDDIGLGFQPAGPLGPVAELVGLCGMTGVLASLFSTAEDAAQRAGSPGPIVVHAAPSCGLSDATLDELGRLLGRCFTVAEDGAEITIGLPRLTFVERLALVERRFDGPAALHELLADLLPEDPSALDRVSRAHERSPVHALLDALSWDGKHDDDVPARAADALAATRRHAEETAGEEAAALQEAFLNLRLALPAYGQRPDARADGLPLPCVPVTPPIAEQIRAGRLATVVKSGEEALIVPFPAVRDAVRARIAPAAVHFLSLEQVVAGLDMPGDGQPWSDVTRIGTLANLALAVAGRQLGGCDVRALTWGARGLARRDYGAAVELVKALLDGLPGWSTVPESLTEVYTDLIGQLAEVDRQHHQEIREDHDTWSGRTDSVLAALHAGEPDRVLALVAAARARLGEDVPWDLRKSEAYALARTGRPGEALAIAVGATKSLPSMSRFDQAELLHLLGDLAERRGRTELAIRYLLDERAVDPPAQSTRLHNRRHLLDLLIHDGSDDGLTMTVAREGLVLARNMDSDPTGFADNLLDLAMSTTDTAQWDEVLDLVGADGTPRLRALATGMHALLRDGPDEGVAALTPLLTERDHISAHAALLLGIGPFTGADRSRVLRLGSEVTEGRGYQDLCARQLLMSYWGDGDYEALTELAESYLGHCVGDLAALARTALGAVALATGRHEEGVRWYAEAVALHGFEVLAGPLGQTVLKGHPGQSYQVGAEASDLLLRRIETEVRGEKPEGVLADIGLIDAIDSWASMYYSESATTELIGLAEARTERLRDTPDAARRATEDLELLLAETRRRQDDGMTDEVVADTAKYLSEISERFWDQANIEAAYVARGQSCRLYEELGDHAALAYELGWMAAIARQADRPGEAETLYQRAIAIGATALSRTDQAFIVGRYGNLLHDRKDVTAAVHQQWHAVCLLRDATPLLTADSLAELGEWPDVPDDLAARWALLLTNLANCLLAVRSPLLRQAVDLATTAHETSRHLLTTRGIGGTHTMSSKPNDCSITCDARPRPTNRSPRTWRTTWTEDRTAQVGAGSGTRWGVKRVNGLPIGAASTATLVAAALAAVG